MYIELKIKTPKETKVFNYHVTNLPRGPHFPWKLYFEVDHEQFDFDFPVKLAKMDFIKNAVLAYTERQDTSFGADYKLKIMAACAESFNDKDFKPLKEFTAAALESKTEGIQVTETEKVQPDAGEFLEMQFGVTNLINNNDIPGIRDYFQSALHYQAALHPQNIPSIPQPYANIPQQPHPFPQAAPAASVQTTDKPRQPNPRFKACTVNKAHAKLRDWERANGILAELQRKMYLWERIQGMPEDVPKEIPVGWFKPPINRNLLLNINCPKEISTLDYEPQSWDRMSMKVVDYIHKYFFGVSGISDIKYGEAKKRSNSCCRCRRRLLCSTKNVSGSNDRYSYDAL